MNPAEKAAPWHSVLLGLELRAEQDIALARQRIRQIGGWLDFDVLGQTRLAAALSEIAGTAWRRAGGGRVEFGIVDAAPDDSPGAQSLLISVSHPADRSAGPPDADAFGSVRRLVDRLDVKVRGGTQVVDIWMRLPPRRERHSPESLAEIGRLAPLPDYGGLVDELSQQNREILLALDEVRAREQELQRVNQELAETNSGVLALYDELETLHRVGMMLAERHNLHDLLQTIIDATTDLTGAEIGAFYYRDTNTGAWRLHAIAGSANAALNQLPSDNPPDFFNEMEAAKGTCRLDDLGQETRGTPCSDWLAIVRNFLPIGSCLFVPVFMAEKRLAGALVFGHSRQAAFSERSERIVSAIAVQASVGIDKAQLFQGLQTAAEAKDRFLAMLSHELRTPLNPVAAILSFLDEDPTLPAHLREDVQVMRRNIELEARLIDDLLDFSRIIRGKFGLHRTYVDVHGLIHSVVGICRAELDGRQQDLELHLDAEKSVVFGDVARLQQILWNLLKNAVKFTPPRGRIAVSTHLDDERRLCVSVADNGSGIDEDVLPGIFSAFDQGRLQPGRFGGLGLGLAIARTFTELHGGQILAASSGLGKGATFTVCLPTAQRPIDPLHAPPHLSPPGDREAPEAVVRRILLVDDHADTVNALARLLRRRGHHVITAITSAEARHLAAHQSFDILISDLGLPDESGLHLVGAVKAIQPIPAIAISGYGMENDVHSSRMAGFDTHITKPINFSLLEETIRSLGR